MPFSLPKTSISLDRASSTYFPGDLITGKVSFSTQKVIAARFIKITWNGEMRTAQSDLCEPFVKNLVSGSRVAWQSRNDMNLLPPGKHCFPFSFKLPKTSEPSFYGEFGSTDYFVKVQMNRPWPLADQEVVKSFFVTKPYDIEEKAAGMKLGAHFANHRVAGTIFKDGQFSMKVKMPTRAFTPGGTIFATVEVDNNTSKSIRSLKASLIQQSHYHYRPSPACTIPEHRSCPLEDKNQGNSETVLQTAKFGYEIAPFSRKSFNIQIDLPKSVQVVFENSMMSIGYLLSFSVKSSSLTGNKLKCNARIVIGTAQKSKTAKSVTSRASGTSRAFQSVKLPISPPPYDPKWSIHQI